MLRGHSGHFHPFVQTPSIIPPNGYHIFKTIKSFHGKLPMSQDALLSLGVSTAHTPYTCPCPNISILKFPKHYYSRSFLILGITQAREQLLFYPGKQFFLFNLVSITCPHTVLISKLPRWTCRVHHWWWISVLSGSTCIHPGISQCKKWSQKSNDPLGRHK